MLRQGGHIALLAWLACQAFMPGTWADDGLGSSNDPIRCYQEETGFSQDQYPYWARGESMFSRMYQGSRKPSKELSAQYALHWRIDTGFIYFGIAVAGKYESLMLGLSDSGGLHGADMCVLTKSINQATSSTDWKATDYWSIDGGAGPLIADTQQDWTLEHWASTGMMTLMQLKRPLDTCDAAQDIPVYHDQDQLVLFANNTSIENSLAINDANVGSYPLRLWPASYGAAINITALANDTSSNNRGNSTESTYRLALLGQDPSDLAQWNVYATKVITRTDDATTYYCQSATLPKKAAGKKLHVIRYSGLVTSLPADNRPGVQVRMTLYACTGVPQTASDDCDGTPDPACTTPIAFWGPGQRPYLLPAEAGIPLGAAGATPTVQLIVQYTTQPGAIPAAAQLTVTSSLTLSYTAQLRPYDIGVLRLGSPHPLTSPSSLTTTLPDSCPATCTFRLQPASATLVANYFQMGATGQAISTRHVRGGVELQPLGAKSHWWPGWQSFTQVLPDSRTLLPGDTLITTCTYPSGVPPTDNACLNYLLYYPAVPGWTECSRAGNSSEASCPLAPSLTAATATNATNVTSATTAYVRNPATVGTALSSMLQAALLAVTTAASNSTALVNSTMPTTGSLSPADAAAIAAALAAALNTTSLASTMQAAVVALAASTPAEQLPALTNATQTPHVLCDTLRAWLTGALNTSTGNPGSATNTTVANTTAGFSSVGSLIAALLPSLNSSLQAAVSSSGLAAVSLAELIAATHAYDILQVLPLSLISAVDTNFTAYAPVCVPPTTPVEPHYATGGAVAAILCITIAMLLVIVLLYHNYARKEDPERQALLAALQQAMLEEAVHHPEMTEEQLRAKLEDKVRAQLLEQGILSQ